jgi:hypothetical protein
VAPLTAPETFSLNKSRFTESAFIGGLCKIDRRPSPNPPVTLIFPENSLSPQ